MPNICTMNNFYTPKVQWQDPDVSRDNKKGQLNNVT